MLNFRTAELIATFLGLGWSRLCPGTLGSVATLPLWFLIMSLVKYFELQSPMLFMALAILVLFFLALRAVDIYLKKKGDPAYDPPEVIADEIIGQLLSFFLSLLIIASLGKVGLDLMQESYGYMLYIFGFVTPVVFFRIFDIWKPGIIGIIDSKMKNALGIMLDDVVAGFLAGLTNLLLFRVVWAFIR
ncbi:MAG: phosphatidylglycerophosphatase A [Rickettsiales bacterium]|jgi:phosphatidylglycerophosphatase A|nr:phosphatidylglycerophosphatase A [Rickettsiales bacterium]